MFDCLCTPAFQSCSQCDGTGVHFSTNSNHKQICYCVWRTVFRVCLQRYRECQLLRSWTGRDFSADFSLIARRALTWQDYEVFRMHFLEGCTWRTTCHRLEMERGAFFHAVYRIERECGRAYQKTRPYALYPPREYFQLVRGPAKAMAMRSGVAA